MATGRFPPRITSLPAFDGPRDAFQLHAEGLRGVVRVDPAGTSIAPHRHDSDNVGVITGGELRLTIDGAVTVVGVGEWSHAADFDVDTSEIELWFGQG